MRGGGAIKDIKGRCDKRKVCLKKGWLVWWVGRLTGLGVTRWFDFRPVECCAPLVEPLRQEATSPATGI
jgi:hypothetical protein